MRLEAKWQAYQSSSFALDCEFVRSNRGLLYWSTFLVDCCSLLVQYLLIGALGLLVVASKE
jgi:hypothetical protein